MLVDAEWSARISNRLDRLIRNAGYADSATCVENIEYHPERKLDRKQILASGLLHLPPGSTQCHHPGPNWSRQNLYLVYALGTAASRSFFSVCYTFPSDLLVEISLAWANSTYRDYMKKLRKRNCSSWVSSCSIRSRRQRPGCSGTGRGQEQGGHCCGMILNSVLISIHQAKVQENITYKNETMIAALKVEKSVQWSP